MNEHPNDIIIAIKKKSLFDVAFLATSYSLEWIYSSIVILLLRLRGFHIGKSVMIKSNTTFFQARKHAVTIDDRSTIGHYVRIIAGFEGKITLGKGVLIDDFSYVSGQRSIQIGEKTLIAAHCYIVDFNHKYPLSNFDQYYTKEI